MQEHRYIHRWQINRHAKVKLEGAQTFATCVIRDISFKGMQISLGIKLPKDRFLKMSIVLSNEFSVDAQLWVAWHKIIDGFNLYGLYFNKIRDLDKEKIYKFIQSNFPGQISKQWWKGLAEQKGDEEMEDRRIFARFPTDLPLRFLDLMGSREGSAKTVDISAKGIGIESSEELAAQTPLEMWLNIPGRSEPLYTRGETVWSKMINPNLYRAGINLEKADFMVTKILTQL